VCACPNPLFSCALQRDGEARLSSLSDEKLLQLISKGELSVHTLENRLGDCTRAVSLRRKFLEGQLSKGGVAKDKAMKDLPVSAFNEELFYKSILGTNCEAVIGCVASRCRCVSVSRVSCSVSRRFGLPPETPPRCCARACVQVPAASCWRCGTSRRRWAAVPRPHGDDGGRAHCVDEPRCSRHHELRECPSLAAAALSAPARCTCLCVTRR
jgi:hypothetical protein